MDKKNIKKEYKTDDITIVWEPAKCIHAAVCVHTLPQVYHPNARPWIEADRASCEELIHQINQCPSGALSYVLHKKQ